MKLLIGQCSICTRKKNMIVFDNTIEVERLGDFFKSLGTRGLNAPKRWHKTFQKILEGLWILQQPLPLQPQAEILKM